MFYHLFYEYFDINLFKYITFRGFYALITAFLLSLLFGPYVINKLKEFQNKKVVMSERTHQIGTK